jgi:hypothetical protein
MGAANCVGLCDEIKEDEEDLQEIAREAEEAAGKKQENGGERLKDESLKSNET